MLELRRKLNIQSKNCLFILEAIKTQGHQARLVGGVVRDAVLGLKSHDVDIATDMLPEEVTKLFSTLGNKVIPTGIKYGTVSVLQNGEFFEITTLRKDLISNGRHPKIEYTDNFQLDAARRDFTINALSYCPFETKIYDYFNGLKDLKDGRVKFIGQPAARIGEDYLRILRFFRFYGRFGREMDQNSLEACIKYKSFLKNLSKERIKSEIDMILGLTNYCPVLGLMAESGILTEILPLSAADFKLEDFIVAKELSITFKICLVNATKYAMLFARGQPIRAVNLVNLSFSRLEARNITDLLSFKDQKNVEINFLKKIWLEQEDFAQIFIFLAVIYKEESKICHLFQELRNRKKPVLPVSGEDLISLGFSGHRVGAALATLKKRWIESDFQLTKQELINTLK